MASNSSHTDRAAGCIVGAFVGDALGPGPHWHDDLEEMRRDFRPWIDGYTTPLPSRKFLAGMRAGELFVLPGAYHLAARFPGDFQSAVPHAINGGAQNMSRAGLTGALMGEQVGLRGIPARSVEGYAEGPGIIALARKVATLPNGNSHLNRELPQ